MDPEQTVLRVQARISGMLSQLLTPRIRTALEYIYLLVAVVLFAVLVFMHINFVQQTGCSSQLSGVQISEAQLFQIKITSVGLWCHIAADASMMKTENQGFLAKDLKVPNDYDNKFSFIVAKFLSTWINSGAKRSKLIFKSWRNEKDTHELQIENSLSHSISSVVPDKTEIKDDLVAPNTEAQQIWFMNRVSLKTAIVHRCSKCHSRFSTFWKNLKWLPGNAGYLWEINYFFFPFAFFLWLYPDMYIKRLIQKCLIL